MRTLLWFRGKDLRLHDHPALSATLNDELCPVFVLDDYFFAPSKARELPHRMQFLLESIAELAAGIEARGSQLGLVRGDCLEVVPRLVHQLKCQRVVAMRWSEPFARARDLRVARRLSVPLVLFEGETLLAPETLRTQSGQPYSVFTPFSRAFLKSVAVDTPLPAPKTLPAWPNALRPPQDRLPSLESLGIQRNEALVPGGEKNARSRLKRFLNGAAKSYADDRDHMGREGTSRISQDLKFGTLSVRAVWRAIERVHGRSKSGQVFQNQLIWREFAHCTLWDRPELLRRPFRPEFVGFPWRQDSDAWQAWVLGKTGYPLVDAAARQLQTEGFVHNRARMVAASFLTKHLLIDYQQGEAHYMKFLVDGDYAQNNLGWQWCAGTGCDAQPYFRVFNPVKQGERFDPHGDYVRKWVPELRQLSERHIHAPWAAPAAALDAAQVELGKNYPAPIVEHAAARSRFLQVAQSYLNKHARPR